MNFKKLNKDNVIQVKEILQKVLTYARLESVTSISIKFTRRDGTTESHFIGIHRKFKDTYMVNKEPKNLKETIRYIERQLRNYIQSNRVVGFRYRVSPYGFDEKDKMIKQFKDAKQIIKSARQRNFKTSEEFVDWVELAINKKRPLFNEIMHLVCSSPTGIQNADIDLVSDEDVLTKYCLYGYLHRTTVDGNKIDFKFKK